MRPRQSIHDLGRCLRAAAPPLLALSALALARTTQREAPAPSEVGELVLVAWRVALLGTLLWFIVAVIWAATGPLRDHRAFQQLQRLRGMATSPDRALVHVQTIVWSSPAGQHVVVVNVATGVTSRVWLPEATVPIGSYVVLEREGSGARVVDWMGAEHVEAGHRHEQRHVAHRHNSSERVLELPEHCHDDARLLIEETEKFLREQGSR